MAGAEGVAHWKEGPVFEKHVNVTRHMPLCGVANWPLLDTTCTALITGSMTHCTGWPSFYCAQGLHEVSD